MPGAYTLAVNRATVVESTTDEKVGPGTLTLRDGVATLKARGNRVLLTRGGMSVVERTRTRVVLRDSAGVEWVATIGCGCGGGR